MILWGKRAQKQADTIKQLAIDSAYHKEQHEKYRAAYDKYVRPQLERRFVRTVCSDYTFALAQQEMGSSHNARNAYGTVVCEEFHEDFPNEVIETTPVICGHGGSMWFCLECAQRTTCVNDTKSATS